METKSKLNYLDIPIVPLKNCSTLLYIVITSYILKENNANDVSSL